MYSEINDDRCQLNFAIINGLLRQFKITKIYQYSSMKQLTNDLQTL